MARSLGIRLFTGYRAVNHFFKHLDLTLHEACDEYFLVRQDEDLPELPDWLCDRFRFRALEIDVPDQVSIGLLGTYTCTAGGDTKRGFKAAFTISYSGSKLLLRTAPVDGFVFPYVGSIGKKTFRVVSLLDTLDPTELASKVAAEIGRVRAALLESHDLVARLNERLRAEIDRKMKTY